MRTPQRAAVDELARDEVGGQRSGEGCDVGAGRRWEQVTGPPPLLTRVRVGDDRRRRGDIVGVRASGDVGQQERLRGDEDRVLPAGASAFGSRYSSVQANRLGRLVAARSKAAVPPSAKSGDRLEQFRQPFRELLDVGIDLKKPAARCLSERPECLLRGSGAALLEQEKPGPGARADCSAVAIAASKSP